jgi:hypothetical protein
MDTTTMANMGVTAVPCARVCGFGEVCSRRSAAVPPPGVGWGARARWGRGNRQNPAHPQLTIDVLPRP